MIDLENEINAAQIKKMRRRINAKVFEMNPNDLIRLALIMNILVPKNLLDQFTQYDQDKP